MLKIYAGFNDRTEDDACWNLVYQDIKLENRIEELRLSPEDNVILYQGDDDFEVVATLDLKFVNALGREAWIAYPDWSTLVRKRSLSR